MITNFVNLEIVNTTRGTLNAVSTRSTIILKYPCTNKTICTPYKLNLKPGAYKVECWGAKGTYHHVNSFPGRGAYTSGLFSVFSELELYVFVGATGRFNSYKNLTENFFNEIVRSGLSGGGATDVRLENSANWFDISSLKSRIMVAAGGGGVEWSNAQGGNGGELEGGKSTSTDIYGNAYPEKCNGATQTNGSACPKYGYHGYPTPGTFGAAGAFTTLRNDYGGLGGGGYYGGTSYDYAYAGSGGSSFISGHEGCKAIKKTNDESIVHKDDSLHYSGYVFHNTNMIGGNKTMPLPSGNEGIWDETDGAFRITHISFDQRTHKCEKLFMSLIFFVTLILLK